MSGQERVKDNGSWLNCCVAHVQFFSQLPHLDKFIFVGISLIFITIIVAIVLIYIKILESNWSSAALI